MRSWVWEVLYTETLQPRRRKEFIADPASCRSARKGEDWGQSVPVNLVLYMVMLLAKTKCEHKNCVWCIAFPN